MLYVVFESSKGMLHVAGRVTDCDYVVVIFNFIVMEYMFVMNQSIFTPSVRIVSVHYCNVAVKPCRKCCV